MNIKTGNGKEHTKLCSINIFDNTERRVIYVMALEIINNTFNKHIDEIKERDIFTLIENDKYEEQYGSSIFNGVFIKISNNISKENAVKLNNGHLYYINNSLDLQGINGRLVI